MNIWIILVCVSFALNLILLLLLVRQKKLNKGFRYSVDTWCQIVYLLKDGVRVGMEPYRDAHQVPKIKERLLNEYNDLQEARRQHNF